jgi:hypothetical protein
MDSRPGAFGDDHREQEHPVAVLGEVERRIGRSDHELDHQGHREHRQGGEPRGQAEHQERGAHELDGRHQIGRKRGRQERHRMQLR